MLSEKSWQPESLLRLGLWLFGCMFLVSLLGSLVFKTGGTSADMSLLQILVCVAGVEVAVFPLVHRFLNEQRMTWREAFGFGSPNRLQTLALAAAATAVALPVAWVVTEWAGRALQGMGAQPVAQPMVVAIQTSNQLMTQIAQGIVAVVLAPPAEEIVFRGILYPFLKHLGHPRIALWGTALLFGGIHANSLAFLALVWLGLVLAWLYEKTGNLLAPILTHSLFNLANFVWLMLLKV